MDQQDYINEHFYASFQTAQSDEEPYFEESVTFDIIQSNNSSLANSQLIQEIKAKNKEIVGIMINKIENLKDAQSLLQSKREKKSSIFSGFLQNAEEETPGLKVDAKDLMMEIINLKRKHKESLANLKKLDSNIFQADETTKILEGRLEKIFGLLRDLDIKRNDKLHDRVSACCIS